MSRPKGARADATPRKILDGRRRQRGIEGRLAGLSWVKTAAIPICRACAHDPHDTDGCPSEFCPCITPDTGPLYSHSEVCRRAVTNAVRQLTTQPAEDLRALEHARLDALTFAVWPRAMKGADDPVRTMLKIMERRAKYEGLDDFERRMARYVEAQSKIDAGLGDQIHQVIFAVLAELDLPADVMFTAPQLIADALAELGLDETKDGDGGE